MLEILPNAVNGVFGLVALWLATRIHNQTFLRKLVRLGILLAAAFALGNVVAWQTVSYSPVNPFVVWLMLILTTGFGVMYVMHYDTLRHTQRTVPSPDWRDGH